MLLEDLGRSLVVQVLVVFDVFEFVKRLFGVAVGQEEDVSRGKTFEVLHAGDHDELEDFIVEILASEVATLSLQR